MSLGPQLNHDPVNRPSHYQGESFECITLTRRMGFCPGNAIKYLWRAAKKGRYLEDMQKARWYVNDCLNDDTHTDNRSLSKDTGIFTSIQDMFPSRVADVMCMIIDGEYRTALFALDEIIGQHVKASIQNAVTEE